MHNGIKILIFMECLVVENPKLIFDHKDHCYIWRGKEDTCQSENILRTVKYSGGSIMLWGFLLQVCLVHFTKQHHERWKYRKWGRSSSFGSSKRTMILSIITQCFGVTIKKPGSLSHRKLVSFWAKWSTKLMQLHQFSL